MPPPSTPLLPGHHDPPGAEPAAPRPGADLFRSLISRPGAAGPRGGCSWPGVPGGSDAAAAVPAPRWAAGEFPAFCHHPWQGWGSGGVSPRVVSPGPGKALPGAERSAGSGRGAGPGALLQPGFLCSECPLNMRCHRLPLPLPAVPALHYFLSHTESACEWR